MALDQRTTTRLVRNVWRWRALWPAEKCRALRHGVDQPSGASMKSFVRSAACLLFGAQLAAAQSPTASVPSGVVHQSTPVSAATQGPSRRPSTTTPTSTVRSAAIGAAPAATHSTGAPTAVTGSSGTGQQAPPGGVGISGSAMSMQVTGANEPSAARMRVMAPTPPKASPTAAAALAAPARQGPKVTPEASTVRAPRVPEGVPPSRTPASTP